MPQIDPALACVWRTPDSLQLGVDPVRVRLDRVSSAEERVLVALLAGVDERRLIAVAIEAGMSPQGLDELLALLDPALSSAPQPRALRIAIERALPDGQEACAIGASVGAPLSSARYDDRLLAHHLGGLGHQLVSRHRADRRRRRPVDLAVLVADFVVPPGVAQHWLSRGIPHLPVVTTDQAVLVGPLVLPGRTACVTCAALDSIDRDDAWPAVAAQLSSSHRRRRAPDAPELALETALFVGRIVDRLRAEPTRDDSDEDTDLDTHLTGIAEIVWRIRPDGSISESASAPHPQCGCQLLAAAARSGSATAAAATTGGATRSPTTVAAPPAPA